MNLWVSRVRQLSVMAVALFFYSCTDDTSLNGFKPTDPKFTAQFIEIPVESSVLLFNPLRSSNYYFYGETPRFLVGNYTDPKLGDGTASSYAQYYPPLETPKLAANAVFDSISLQLSFDFYSYGASKSATSQKVSIYELDQILYDTLRKSYLTNTPTPPLLGLLGTKSFTVDPVEFQSYLDTGRVNPLTLNIPIDITFGQKLFESAIKYRDGTDTTFGYPSLFVKKFKGIAIVPVPNECDKLVGFSPSNLSTAITLHYHVDTVSHKLNLVFVQGTSYNNISINRMGTELSGLTQPYLDFSPLDDKRYIQSGAGIFTKLDIGKFLEFTDTIPNIMINSAELVVGNVEDGEAYDPPKALVLRVLNENNTEYAYDPKKAQSVTDFSMYENFIKPDLFYSAQLPPLVNSDSIFTVDNDAEGYLNLPYSKSEKKYNGYLTRFLQQIAVKETDKTQLQYFVLYPSSPSAAKSVNRVVFPKDNIKLRIYYTLPTLKN